jgi:CubicO group peptidase (beta-lactamase class C family)
MNKELLRDAVACVDQWLAYQQQLKEIPAVAVAVRQGDELLLSKGYGYANLERRVPVTPAHIFRATVRRVGLVSGSHSGGRSRGRPGR